MEDVISWLIAALFGSIAYFVGSMTSPHAKAYKVQAQTWQGQYSGLKKQLVELQGAADANDPFMQVLNSLGLDPKTAKLIKPFVTGIMENYAKTGKLVVPGLGQIGGDKKDGGDLTKWT